MFILAAVSTPSAFAHPFVVLDIGALSEEWDSVEAAVVSVAFLSLASVTGITVVV